MITVGIPTYNRGRILVSTVEALLALPAPPDEILIADQTREHPSDVRERLEKLSLAGSIVWIRLPEPSIPRAMNVLLARARNPIVLFLDDDIEPSPKLISAHAAAHADPEIWAVAGQVLQPGEEPVDHTVTDDGLEFRFNHAGRVRIRNVMAGNLSVSRDRALAIGGFDENFIGAAYRFETDFALRLSAAGGVILFEPGASIRHLHLSSGGLRSFGDHRAARSPLHSIGDYYFALRHERGFVRYAIRRLRKNVLTRYHLRHPWSIPSKLFGEIRGAMGALRLIRLGPKLIDSETAAAGNSTSQSVARHE